MTYSSLFIQWNMLKLQEKVGMGQLTSRETHLSPKHFVFLCWI